MNLRNFKRVLLASALFGALGSAFAQQAPTVGNGSMLPTPAEAKTATDIQGNAALTSDIALAGTPRQGKPGTQSGEAVTPTMVMGAGPANVIVSSQTFVGPSLEGLSGTQLRALERYEALR